MKPLGMLVDRCLEHGCILPKIPDRDFCAFHIEVYRRGESLEGDRGERLDLVLTRGFRITNGIPSYSRDPEDPLEFGMYTRKPVRDKMRELFLEGRSSHEIARILGISRNTVMKFRKMTPSVPYTVKRREKVCMCE
jgi:hypothetical protein